MKYNITFTLALISTISFSQTTFVVDNFSKDYFGKLYIADTNEVFSQGWVAIFDKKSKQQLIKINSDELTFEPHSGEILANVKELPYGEQSQILYEDYNFDGMKDFAIMDGQNSCYHGPSFQIYLSTAKGFIQSAEFTRLAQEYCGMFNVDYETKTINTMTKSGCCWHQFSEFKVKNNKPYPIKIVEEGMSASGIAWDYVELNLVKGKMVKSVSQRLVEDVIEDNLMLSFEFKNKKKMLIFMTETILNYVFTDAKGNIELLYNDTFKYSNSENTLSFKNRNTEYTIFDNKIIAKSPNKTYEMNAVDTNKFGSLTKLKDLKFENVIY